VVFMACEMAPCLMLRFICRRRNSAVSFCTRPSFIWQPPMVFICARITPL